MKPYAKNWRSLLVSPETVVERFRPGMRIFLSTGVAEPRTMVRHLLGLRAKNLEDVEFIQLVSFGDAISMQSLRSQNFRLKTFFSGWAADEAVKEGRVDLIPSRFMKIPQLISSGQLQIDAAVVQITPPNADGYASLGVAVDVAREAMEKSEISIGEVNLQIPVTHGDTFVPITEFDYLILSEDPPIFFERWPVRPVMEEVARNAVHLIEDGSCIAFSIGPLYEALAIYLKDKSDLGIHSPFFTDPVMDLMKSGAVSNRRKESYRGKALTSYAFGTSELMDWLDGNPLIEFQRIDKVFSPVSVGRNSKFVTVIPARKLDLYGRVGLPAGKGTVATGPAEVMDFFAGAQLSEGGKAIFAMTSRDSMGNPNILPSISDLPNQFGGLESVFYVVTEYGLAYLEGRTIRERAQALIDIAHPDDRGMLVEKAKARKILYPDQIFLSDSGRLYPSGINADIDCKDGLKIRFRAIKPSDEEGMRNLFYRFSDESTYQRYFHPVSSMPHSKMQEYVNVDWKNVMSIIGLVGEEGKGTIIAEGRYIIIPGSQDAELSFVVDENYQRRGIATFLYNMLIRLARERGIKRFLADVIFSNTGMMKVFQKGGLEVHAQLEEGVYHLNLPIR